MVARFRLGLRLEVTDRKAFKEYMSQYGSRVAFESWAGNSVPTAMVILDDRKEEDDEVPYYKIRNEHPNGNETTINIYHDMIQQMIDENLLVESGDK